jgi:outer membrane lipoprotein-sorting protein
MGGADLARQKVSGSGQTLWVTNSKFMNRGRLMSDRNSLTAVVRLSQRDQLGESMKRLRIWLDSERIEPSEFTTAADAGGYTFTITFRSLRDVEHFCTQFQALPILQPDILYR